MKQSPPTRDRRASPSLLSSRPQRASDPVRGGDISEVCEAFIDCIAAAAPGSLGYTTGDGTPYGYCHPLVEGDNDFVQVSVIPLDEDTETLFNADHEPRITYYLESSAGDCWVWGHNTDYYRALGCTEI